MMTEGYPPDERETSAERDDTDALLDRAQEGGRMSTFDFRAANTPPVGEAPDRPCGRCHDGTGFEWDGMGWVSVCCGAPPASEEAPPWMGTD